jgi:flagellar hook protein FlgE
MVASPATLATISASDDMNFISRSIPGGTLTTYDSLGSAVPVDLRWAKTDTPGPFTWSLYVQTDPAATGAAAKWTRVGTPGQWAFNPPPASGNLISATTATLPPVTFNGVTVSGINFTTGPGGRGLNSFDSDGTGQLNSLSLNQDGYSAGVLQETSIASDGQILGSYSNGLVRPLAQLLTARFSSPDALKRLDGGTFAETTESGVPLIGSASAGGTQLVGGSLEQSNTDIADEFSKMIVTQQAYSANTRVITTSQQMLSDIINIIR